MGTDDHFDVFLSYARDDARAVVDAIERRLVARDLKVFVDHQQLDPYEPKPPVVIDEALSRSRLVALLVSPGYANRPYCIHEAGRGLDGALRRRNDLLVIRTAPDATLPPFLNNGEAVSEGVPAEIAQRVADRLAQRQGLRVGDAVVELVVWCAWTGHGWVLQGVEVLADGGFERRIETSLRVAREWSRLGLPRVFWRLGGGVGDHAAVARWRDGLPASLRPVVTVDAHDVERSPVCVANGRTWAVEVARPHRRVLPSAGPCWGRFHVDDLELNGPVDHARRLRRLRDRAGGLLIEGVSTLEVVRRVSELVPGADGLWFQGPCVSSLESLVTRPVGVLR